jgi:hypothetical protein
VPTLLFRGFGSFRSKGEPIMCFYIPQCEEYHSFDLPTSLFGGKKTMTCYKVLNKYESIGYYSPYRYVAYPESGIVKSDRITKKVCGYERGGGIRNGIHVYTDLETAKIHADWSFNRVIIPVICESKDFVAYNGAMKEAVFMKVRVHKRAKNMRSFKRNKTNK